jgi:hypothetical protein
LPDIDELFREKYEGRGLRVVALDAHDELEQIDGVRRFIGELGLAYPVGLEQSGTYEALTANFEGTNPFPVDVVVDRDGTIAYIGREYDPLVLTEVVEKLLSTP